jgi:hypothetical protein
MFIYVHNNHLHTYPCYSPKYICKWLSYFGSVKGKSMSTIAKMNVLKWRMSWNIFQVPQVPPSDPISCNLKIIIINDVFSTLCHLLPLSTPIYIMFSSFCCCFCHFLVDHLFTWHPRCHPPPSYSYWHSLSLDQTLHKPKKKLSQI